MLPETIHQAAREGWRIRVVCKCGRSGEVSHGTLQARPDQNIGDVRWRCPRDGCRMAREAQVFAPGYVRPPRVPLGLVDCQPPRTDHMAKFMQLMNVAIVESQRQQLAELEARDAPRIASWRRAP